MKIVGRRRSLRIVIFGMLVAFLAGILVMQTRVSPPLLAKGVVRTQPKEDESSDEEKEEETKSEEQKEGQKPTPPPAEPRREESPSRSNEGVFERREERREQPREERKEATPERRGEGTPDVRGQIQKREERRDPEYEYRKHYLDPFFYPYDRNMHSHYPYYDHGTIIIIDRDTWDDSRKRWRRTYRYLNPLPGSLEEALVDIEATWWEEDPEFLMWHIDHLGSVDIYHNGKYSHTLSPRQIFKLTEDALRRIDTTDFYFTSVDRHGFTARAKARHRFVGPDRDERTAYLTYHLEKVRERWVINRIDIHDGRSGSLRCFIATAAYGSPLEKEVVVLREFRDRYLLTNRPGRIFVATYYLASPPVARAIEKSDTARGVVRALLEPVVHACKPLVPKKAR